MIYLSKIIIRIEAQLKWNLVKLSTYIGSSKEVNHKDPERKIGDIVRIS